MTGDWGRIRPLNGKRLDDLGKLKTEIREQNALSSIDLVYFLLVPVTIFVLSQLPHAEIPETLFLFFFPSGLISMPIGIYAKMVDSVTARIMAWSVYIRLSTVVYASIVSIQIILQLSPSSLGVNWFFIRKTAGRKTRQVATRTRIKAI